MTEATLKTRNVDRLQEHAERIECAWADKVATLCTKVEDQGVLIARLRVENAQLRKALRPFADYGVIILGQRTSNTNVMLEIFDTKVTAGDFRNAALAVRSDD